MVKHYRLTVPQPVQALRKVVAAKFDTSFTAAQNIAETDAVLACTPTHTAGSRNFVSCPDGSFLNTMLNALGIYVHFCCNCA